MPGEKLFPKGSPPPIAPYSPGMKAGNTVYVSGAVPMDANGDMVGVGDIAVQTEKTIQNMSDVLEAGGASLDDVVMVQIFLTDFKNYRPMNEVYGKYFGKNPPARFCVKCELVMPEFLVEIAAIAVIGG